MRRTLPLEIVEHIFGDVPRFLGWGYAIALVGLY